MGTGASTIETSSSATTSLSNPIFSPTLQTFTSNGSAATTQSHTLSQSHEEPLVPNLDGYRWRKYGQKTVKGSEFPRSYFKCTYPGCGVKKYVEKYEETGKQMERVSYKGEHIHDPSKITHLNAADQLSFKNSVLSESIVQQELIKSEPTEGTSTATTTPLSTPSPTPSNTSFSTTSISGLPLQTTTTATTTISSPTASSSASMNYLGTPRLVVQTSVDVDCMDDGYNWRKYGQKLVRGAANPRSYYKCTEDDCPVKKQVEQKGNVIINTYEGTHNHLAPGLEDGIPTKKKKRKISRFNALSECATHSAITALNAAAALNASHTAITALNAATTTAITALNAHPLTAANALNASTSFNAADSLHASTSFNASNSLNSTALNNGSIALNGSAALNNGSSSTTTEVIASSESMPLITLVDSSTTTTTTHSAVESNSASTNNNSVSVTLERAAAAVTLPSNESNSINVAMNSTVSAAI